MEKQSFRINTIHPNIIDNDVSSICTLQVHVCMCVMRSFMKINDILLKRKHHFAKCATPFTLLDISFFKRKIPR